MARGRTTALTISLTPEERQTLLAWQRSTTIRAGLLRRARMILLLADGAIDYRHCSQGRDQPALCVQMGAAVFGAGRRGLGGQTGPGGQAAPGSPTGAARHGRGITLVRCMRHGQAAVVLSRRGWPFLLSYVESTNIDQYAVTVSEHLFGWTVIPRHSLTAPRQRRTTASRAGCPFPERTSLCRPAVVSSRVPPSWAAPSCSVCAFDLDQAQSQASIDISQDLLTTYDIPNAAGEYGHSFLVGRNAENRRVGGFQTPEHGLQEGSFTITPAGVTRLFTCGPDVTWTQVQGMNVQGAMAGWCATRTGDTWSVTSFFRSEGGVITRLRFPGATATEARDVNDQETVAGWYRDISGADHGFRWDRRTKRYTSFDVPFNDAVGTRLHTITNAGVIGAEYLTFDHETRGALLRQGRWTAIAAINGAFAFTHLTDDGRVFGHGIDPAGSRHTSFVWQQGVVTRLQWPLLQHHRAFVQRLTPGALLVGRVDTHFPPPPDAPEGTDGETRSHGFVVPLAALLGSTDGPPPAAMAARMARAGACR